MARPRTEVPFDTVKALAEKGLGAKAIARVLSERLGKPISPMTVWRILNRDQAQAGKPLFPKLE